MQHGGGQTPCLSVAHIPQLGLLEVEIVLLLFPGLEVLCLLLPLQHLQLLFAHGLLPLSLQPQLLHLGARGEECRIAGQWESWGACLPCVLSGHGVPWGEG